MASNTRQLALGALAAVAVGLVVVLLVPRPDTPVTVAAMPTTEQATPESDAPELEAVAEATPEAAPDSPEQVAAVPDPIAPRLESFFMGTDGVATIAGRADAGQTVAIILAGETMDEVMTDRSGAFAAALVFPASTTPRRLTLLADPAGARIASVEAFMVGPTAALLPVPDAPSEALIAGAVTVPTDPPVAEDPVVEAAEDPVAPGPDAPSEAAAIETTDVTPDTPRQTAQTEVGVAPAATAAPEIEPAPPAAAPTIIAASEDGVRVVQGGAGPQVLSAIALDTITYDPAGEVVLAGRAVGEGFVQVYLDNAPIRSAQIDAGNWQIDLPEIDSGIYTLRVDEVGADGAVVSRIETPFKREEPAAVAAVMAEDTNADGFDVAVRTVQPGATLWAIARETLGDGVLYVAVYEANRDLIRDPDLIYPGQVFRIPEAGE